MNLVDLIKNLLSGELLAKLSSLIGESEEKTKAAASAAIPALLAGLSGAASSPGGTEKVVNALRSPEVGSLDNVTDAITGGDTGALVEKGLGWLSSLLGGGGLIGLITALMKATGLGEGALKKLLGAALPLVLGAITSQLKGKGLPLDASSLSNLFSEQKANITHALPPGLSLASIPGAAAVKDAAQSSGDTLYKMILPVLGVAAAALLAISFFNSNRAKEEGNNNPPKSDPVVKSVDAEATEATAIGTSFNESVQFLTKTLGEVKDAATAEAAAPEIAKTGLQLDEIKGKLSKLAAGAGKDALVSTIKVAADKLKELADKVLAIPGVGEKLKPTVEIILDKLKALTA